ncbi:MAG: hypothetical protein NT062_01675 [Proteobacteria bacterium]|nr:hypothetical protein [Pseudomonadota bacterium]
MTRTLVILAWLLGACVPHTRSGDFECSQQLDCDPIGRVCSEGYCVVGAPIDAPGCPAACDACDLVTKTCKINCNNASDCTGLSCPDGYACDITCRTNACPFIDCTKGASCKVACNGANSCGQITCGTGRCDIACNQNSNACGIIDCQSSCACDVTCDTATCGLQSCPVDSSNKRCATGASSPCSSMAPGCDTCP